MPSPLHESIVTILNEEIIVTKKSLPQYIDKTISTTCGLDYDDFGDKWAYSQKRPDLAIRVENAFEELEFKWVLEVGFAETYEQLVEDMKLWLEGCESISMAVLVKFTETPAYKCPVSFDQDLEELCIPSMPAEVRSRDVVANGDFGPIFYRDQQWVGHISEAFMEVWKRDTNIAKRQDDRIDLFDTAQHSIQFKLRSFLTLDPQNDRTISLDLDQFHIALKKEIKELAVHRCRQMLRLRAKRMGEGPDDRDYEP
jgi:hypothetical protein